MGENPAQGSSQRSTSVLALRLLATLLIAVPLVVYAAVGFYRYHDLHQAAERRLIALQRVTTEHALKVFDTNQVILERLSDAIGTLDDAGVTSRRGDLETFFRNVSASKPQIQSIWVLGKDGLPLASNKALPQPPNLSAADRPYFLWHREKRGGTYISGPLTGRYTGVRFFDMSIGRYTQTGDFTGVISASLSPDYFTKIHETILSDETGVAVTMFRSDGVILSRWPVLANAPPQLAPSSPVMERVARGEREGRVVGVSSIDGRKRLLTFAQIGDYPVFMGTGMDYAAIQQAWLNEMGVFAAFGVPPLLGLFFVGRLALRRTHEALLASEKATSEAENRRVAERALMQSQKLEALGQLTGGVAHDFNNALMVLSSNLFLVKRELKESFGPRLQAMERAIASASQLTRQLLAFSRRQPLVPELVLLQDQLPKLTALLAPVVGSHIKYSLEVEPDTHPVVVDPAELELAVLNLAINARDAMLTSGSLSIRVRNEARPPAPLTGIAVVIEVTDTGSGIDSALLTKVFEPFFTTKAAGVGTGLGLSQVYALCQRAGGVATIESTVGVGTTVRLVFPAAVGAQVGSKPAPGAQPAINKDVLLVEDNDEVATALLGVLHDLGCQVTWAPNAVEAQHRLASGKALPDVMLTDVVMPGEMNGFDLARFVRATYPGVRIVIMTGHTQQLDSIAARGFEVIPKPSSPEVFAAAIAGASQGGTPANMAERR